MGLRTYKNWGALVCLPSVFSNREPNFLVLRRGSKVHKNHNSQPTMALSSPTAPFHIKRQQSLTWKKVMRDYSRYFMGQKCRDFGLIVPFPSQHVCPHPMRTTGSFGSTPHTHETVFSTIFRVSEAGDSRNIITKRRQYQCFWESTTMVS